METKTYITNKHIVTFQEDEIEELMVKAAKDKIGKDVEGYEYSVHFDLGEGYLRQIEVTLENTSEVK